MTTPDAIGFAVLTLVFLLTLPRARALWRGGPAIAETERFYRSFWPYSDAALRGWLRAQVAGMLDFMCAYVAGTEAVLKSLVPRGAWPILEMLGVIGLAGVFLMTVAVVSIVLFNMPKLLVIPELRGQEGLVAYWRRSRRNHPPHR